jgi:hypothetical protein
MPKRRNSGKNTKDSTVYDSKLNNAYWKNKTLERIRKWNLNNRRWERETDEERAKRLLGQNINIKNAVALETSLQAKMAEEANLAQPITVIEESKIEDSARSESSFHNTDNLTNAERATGHHSIKKSGVFQKSETPVLAVLGEPIVEAHEVLPIIEENIIKGEEVIEILDSLPITNTGAHPLWIDPTLWTFDPIHESDRFGYHPLLVDNIRENVDDKSHFTEQERVFIVTQINLSLALPDTLVDTREKAIRHFMKRFKIAPSRLTDETLVSRYSSNYIRWSERYGIKEIVPSWEKRKHVTDNDRIILYQDFTPLTKNYNFKIAEAGHLINIIHGTDLSGFTMSDWDATGKRKVYSTQSQNQEKKEEKATMTQTNTLTERDAEYWIDTSKSEEEVTQEYGGVGWKLADSFIHGTMDFLKHALPKIQEDLKREFEAEVQPQIERMRSEIRRLNGDTTSLESTVDSLTTSKKSLQKKDKAQAKTITTLESEKSALEEENLNLGVRVEELESNVAQLIMKRNESGLSGAYNAIRNKAGRGK